MLDLHTTHLAGHAVVRARGTFDGDAGTLTDYLLARVAADDRSLVLDLHTCAGLDASHGTVVAAAAAAATAQGARVVVVAGEQVREAVRAADQALVVSESLDAALADSAPALDPARGHVRPNDPNHPIMAFGA